MVTASKRLSGNSIKSEDIDREDYSVVRWLIWTAVVIVWTVGLEWPVPDPGHGPAREFILTYKYVVGKSLHVAVYALLAVLSAWVPTTARYRWLMMFFLMGHAWGTEMLQETLEEWCYRGGSLSDVGFDLIGIVAGVAVSWKWWTKSP
jgi:hypothetical protein